MCHFQINVWTLCVTEQINPYLVAFCLLKITTKRVFLMSSQKNTTTRQKKELGTVFSAVFSSWNQVSTVFAKELNTLPMPMKYANLLKEV